MSALVWSPVAPNEPGAYWYRSIDVSATLCMVVEDDSGRGELRVFWLSPHANRRISRLVADGVAFEWAGPLPDAPEAP